MTASFHLPEGVYLAQVGGVHLFLDATSDRYVTLSGNQSRWFEEIRNMDATSSLSNIAEQFANRLVERGLLSQDAQQGKPLRESDVPVTQSSAYDPVALDARGVSAREVAAILHAVASSWWLCRRHRSNVEAILRAVKSWKFSPSSREHAETERVRELSQKFVALSPYFFSAHDACFFRSLALIKFLSSFGVHADWVFAIRLAAFRAHCWVEYDRIALNEAHDTVLEYKPIMVV